MGQYYMAIILAPKGYSKHERIRLFVRSFSYHSGSKLTEHSYLNNQFVESFEFLLSAEGSAYMSRVVWAGDYADKEPLVGGDLEGEAKNLNEIANETDNRRLEQAPPICSTAQFRYIVNHDKKQYVDKHKSVRNAHGYRIHPLPILVAEGNGRGGGDYRGPDGDKVGIWARDVISVETEPPVDCTELVVNFVDND
jgi:hypothetical protein